MGKHPNSPGYGDSEVEYSHSQVVDQAVLDERWSRLRDEESLEDFVVMVSSRPISASVLILFKDMFQPHNM